LVLVIGRGKDAIAYPITGETRVIEDRFRDEDIVVTIDPPNQTASAYRDDEQRHKLPSRIAYWFAAVAAEPLINIRKMTPSHRPGS
jgi:hypothetical protein